ncbi:hypothetical protein DSO57_1010839 [Entomophthora muscae]|uniref:Uncharacterized protein n=1 Tax=Entomophthora muscae TaxID=34485 RepID=A0ACC2RXG7_9FUNG|nr:hypothetical protein DSO57_1010839 [Entomophthora muscae]
MSEHPAFSMSALCAIGGLIGYAKTGSMPSAVAGLFFSGLYGGNGVLIKKQSEYCYESAIFTSLLLAGSQAPRAVRLRKPVPIALASTALLNGIYYSKKAYDNRYGV